MTGMRFFTVYGPVGRPDMAYYRFTEKLVKGEKIELYNQGKNKRDFTYIDDVINVVCRIIPLYNDSIDGRIKYQIFNVGNNHPIDTLSFVEVLIGALKERSLITSTIKRDDVVKLVDSVLGDVDFTYADIGMIYSKLNIYPQITIQEGIRKFAEWFDEYESYSNH